MHAVVAFVVGLLFALGLGLGRMTDPARVLAFLDVGGAWDPSLAFVMGGAVLANLGPTWWTIRRGEPLLGGRLGLPTRSDVDPKLVGGAALFGIGWGLAGYCPGPGLVALGAGTTEGIAFVVAMAVGMVAANHLDAWRARRALGGG